MVTVPKGVSSFDIKLPIVESGLEPKQKLTVNVTAFVRGYAMTNPTQTVGGLRPLLYSSVTEEQFG